MSSLRLFIVDDSDLMCARLSQRLAEIAGVEVVGIAHNAREAWKFIQKNLPDAAILDICMPGGNGIEVLKQIRQAGYPTKVVIYTNYPYPQYRRRCLEAGADYFFDKYNDFEKLFAVVGDLARAKAGAARAARPAKGDLR